MRYSWWVARPLTAHEQQILRERRESLERMRKEHAKHLRALERRLGSGPTDSETLLGAISPSPIPQPALVAEVVHAVIDVLTHAPFSGVWLLDEEPDSKTFLRPVVCYADGARHDPAALAFAIVLSEVEWEQLRQDLLRESASPPRPS